MPKPPPDAIAHLCASESLFTALITRIGPYALASRAYDPYEALIRAVAGQQLHARAVEAILTRFVSLYAGTFPTPAQLLATEAATLRACGLSANKIAAIHDIAAKTLDGTVPTPAQATTLTDEDLIARLTSLRGVGRWTVEMLLIFTLGRPDILPVDDFAIREGWRRLTGAPTQLKPRALAEIGQAWSPHRTTAAWYLWRAADEAKLKPKVAA